MHLRLSLLIFFFTFSLLFIPTLQAQEAETDFVNGYIITNKKDTIHGLVKHAQAFPYHIMDDVLFKEDEASRKKRYAPVDLIEFMADKTIYHSVSYAGSDYTHHKEFMKLTIEGEVSLYSWTTTLPGASMNNPGVHDATTFFLRRKKDKIATEVIMLGFRKMASAYFADYTELAEKIKQKIYKKDDLEEIVNLYNNWAKDQLR